MSEVNISKVTKFHVEVFSNMLQPEYTDYCKKCKQKTTYEFNDYVDGEMVSYKCKNCGNIRATTLKDGDNVIVY